MKPYDRYSKCPHCLLTLNSDGRCPEASSDWKCGRESHLILPDGKGEHKNCAVCKNDI